MASASLLTSDTRVDQPRPNVPQVERPCRKESLASQKALMKVFASRLAAAAIVFLPMIPSAGTP